MRNANRRLTLKSRPTGLAGPEHFSRGNHTGARPRRRRGAAGDAVSVDRSGDAVVDERERCRGAIGEVMRGGGIARVLESRRRRSARRIGAGTARVADASDIAGETSAEGRCYARRPLAWIGPLGLSAVTAYFGMRDIGASVQASVLVSAAAGGVGQIAAQIGRIEACRVVGIAGGAAKCAWLARRTAARCGDRLQGGLAARSAVPARRHRSLFRQCRRPSWTPRCCICATTRAWCCAAASRRSPPIRPTASAILASDRPRAHAGFPGVPLPRSLRGSARLAGRAPRDASGSACTSWRTAPRARGLGMLFRGENTGKLVVQVAS